MVKIIPCNKLRQEDIAIFKIKSTYFWRRAGKQTNFSGRNWEIIIEGESKLEGKIRESFLLRCIFIRGAPGWHSS